MPITKWRCAIAVSHEIHFLAVLRFGARSELAMKFISWLYFVAIAQ
jgi:hypothetical protein